MRVNYIHDYLRTMVEEKILLQIPLLNLILVRLNKMRQSILLVTRDG